MLYLQSCLPNAQDKKDLPQSRFEYLQTGIWESINTEDAVFTPADVIGLSIIRRYGGWRRVSNNDDIWEQRQVKIAIELHLGVSNPSELKIVSRCLGTNKPSFDKLIKEIHNQLNKRT